MRLWKRDYGDAFFAADFAGRIMLQNEYGIRKSAYGWNLDHLRPICKDGKTAESNLICCNILTNDEKADRFPVFHANDILFEVVKVHKDTYKIQRADHLTIQEQDKIGIETNFYDAVDGLGLFHRLLKNPPRNLLTGEVLVTLRGVKQLTAFTSFICTIFEGMNISICSNAHDRELRILLHSHGIKQSSDVTAILDECILLNSYLGQYFVPRRLVESYDIFYRLIDCLEGAFLDTRLGEGDHGFHGPRPDDAPGHNAHTETIYRLDNALYIDRHVWESTKAHHDVMLLTDDWAKYNSYFKALSAQLRKEVGEL